MQNYKDLVLENQIGSMQIAQPIQDGISKIDKYPLDVVEKLGKYQFIYDFQFRNPIFNNLPVNYLTNTAGIYKDGGSNTNGTYNFDGDGTGVMKNLSVLFPKSVKINSEPQVGSFSKGNIVNVLRFDTNNNAIIENPNYVQPDPNAPKTFWAGLMGDLKNQKEFSVPKKYLQKVDDSTPITIETGINIGANPIPQPVDNYTKPISQTTVLEENATFILNSDFLYISGFVANVCPPNELCKGGMTPQNSVLKSGTKISGRLIRRPNNIMFKLKAGFSAPPPYNDFLVVNGVGSDGFIEIPIEYLTRDVATNTNNNNGAVVPVKNNNKNLLMIVGAFLVGYVVFGKSSKTN